MQTFLQDYLNQQKDSGFPDFKGARVEGSIPFSAEMLNAILASIPKVNTDSLRINQLKLVGSNRFSARISAVIKKRVPIIGEVKVPIHPVVVFRLTPAIYPTLTLLVEEVSGLPGGLLDLLTPLFSDMAGTGTFSIQGHTITVRLDAALQKSPTSKTVAALIQQLAVRWHEDEDGDYYVTLDFLLAA